MNINYLPREIMESLGDIDMQKLTGVKAFCDLRGKTGDGYIFIVENTLHLFSKAYGSDLEHFTGTSTDSVNLVVRDERFSLFLDVQINELSFSCRFSSVDKDDLDNLVHTWTTQVTNQTAENQSEEPPTIADSTPVQEPNIHEIDISIKDAFAAALLFAGCSDGELSDKEQSFINSICSEAAVQNGVAFYENHSFETLLNLLRGISKEQKYCFLANMIELTMIDSVIHRSENRIFNDFSHAMNIDADTHAAIYDVLMAKNNFSVFHQQ